MGFKPLDSDARAIVNDLGRYGGFSTDKIELYYSVDDRVRRRLAAAQICNHGKTRYIFYDPNFIKSLKLDPTSTTWPSYFVLAHEVAHHINGDTLDTKPQVDPRLELAADRSAALWLTRRGATVQNLLDGLDTLGVSEDDNKVGYPGRCERRMGVILSYDEAARQINETGGSLPIWQVCNDCLAVAAAKALYVTRQTVSAGSPLLQRDIVACGTRATSDDLPLSFRSDIAGMCAVESLKQGDRLTWNNIGLCSLIRR